MGEDGERVPVISSPYRGLPYWYKGQVHCHSDNSGDVSPDPRLPAEVAHKYSPAGVERGYAAKGYSFVCLTDHNESTPDPGVPGILHITSGEDGYGCRHHVLVLGIDFERVRSYHEYVDPDRDSNQNGLADAMTCPCENIQTRIDYATQVQDAVAVIAHPGSGHYSSLIHWGCSEGWSEECVLASDRYTGIEVYNSGWHHMPYYTQALEHRRLQGKGPIWAFAVDDCHQVFDNPSGFNRGWIVVNAQVGPAERALSSERGRAALQADILHNIRGGNFYGVVREPNLEVPPDDGPADCGPVMRISADANVVSVESDLECIDIEFLDSAPTVRKHVFNVSAASYQAVGNEGYISILLKQRRPDGRFYEVFSQPLLVTTRAAVAKALDSALLLAGSAPIDASPLLGGVPLITSLPFLGQ
jgi:hypothetical protein